jgi:hypothetical protein
VAQRIDDGRQLPKDAKPCKSAAAYAKWNKSHTYCQGCGIEDSLTTHHIVKCGRAHEGCNLLRLCIHCHDLAEGLTIRENGVVLAKFTIGVCLTLKYYREPLQWDYGRLRELRLSNLPDMEAVPSRQERQFRSRIAGRGLWVPDNLVNWS